MCSNPYCAELDTCLVCRKGTEHLVDDDCEGADIGAEILDSTDWGCGSGLIMGPIGGAMDNAGCFAGLEFIGDVGRDPIEDPGTND